MIGTSADLARELEAVSARLSWRPPGLDMSESVSAMVAADAATVLRAAVALRALAAERTAAAPDVVERVGHILAIHFDHHSSYLDAIAEDALAALRPGDEVPAGVVVPREMTEEMIEAASHAGLSARDLIRDKHPHRRGFADAEWLPASWRAALSAIKGGEDE